MLSFTGKVSYIHDWATGTEAKQALMKELQQQLLMQLPTLTLLGMHFTLYMLSLKAMHAVHGERQEASRLDEALMTEHQELQQQLLTQLQP